MDSTYLMSSVAGLVFVEPEVDASVEVAREPEVQADGLRVTDMQEPIRLGRKPRG
jgi:hypothetical protein